MALKELSIGLGILAGTAGITNSGYGIYQNFVVKPARNVEYNQSIIKQTPIVVETVEIQPDQGLAMRIEVTVKIFKTGDIMVESGTRRQFIPFRLAATDLAFGALLGSAHAGERVVIDGVEYDVEVVKYTEQTSVLSADRYQRVRIFADGTVETAIIDIRSNKVLETRTERRVLSEAERQAIDTSPYKKKIFTPKS